MWLFRLYIANEWKFQLCQCNDKLALKIFVNDQVEVYQPNQWRRVYGKVSTGGTELNIEHKIEIVQFQFCTPDYSTDREARKQRQFVTYDPLICQLTKHRCHHYDMHPTPISESQH